MAVFADGFEFHCHPNNRLADDMNKRRAIIKSDKYHVWSITWEDLNTEHPEHNMVCHVKVAATLAEYAGKARTLSLPPADAIVRNGMEQLKAFLLHPNADAWQILANFIGAWPLQLLYARRKVLMSDLEPALKTWREGHAMPGLAHSEQGDWVYNDRAGLNQDIITYISVEDVLTSQNKNVFILLRLGDSESEVTGSDFRERWRRFLACVNLYQFCANFSFWTVKEIEKETAPDIPISIQQLVPDAWQEVMEEVIRALRPLISLLAKEEVPVPQVEYYNEEIDDDAFAELAWPENTPPVAVLSGDQADFAGTWQKLGWKTVVLEELQARGNEWFIEIIQNSVKGD